jgi:hypothetical protein
VIVVLQGSDRLAGVPINFSTELKERDIGKNEAVRQVMKNGF